MSMASSYPLTLKFHDSGLPSLCKYWVKDITNSSYCTSSVNQQQLNTSCTNLSSKDKSTVNKLKPCYILYLTQARFEPCSRGTIARRRGAHHAHLVLPLANRA